ncbi:MAG: hypothetical protein IIT49_00240 [Clostridia bacterium]|nr:hypothetical protein [Clostridia bacterium]
MSKQVLSNRSAHEMPSNYRFNCMDLVKFICAILVLMIHVRPFDPQKLGAEDFTNINFILKNHICRLAVPFYFTASGFLLFKKIDIKKPDTERIRGYCLKLLRLFGTWSFLLFVGKHYQLWYLEASVLAVAVLGFMMKKGVKMGKIILFSVIMYIIALLGDSYYGFLAMLKNYNVTKPFMDVYDSMHTSVRNRMFFGFIFIIMGALFSQRKIVINNAVAVIGFIVSLGAMFFEGYMLKQHSAPKDLQVYISLVPAVFFLFYLSTHIKLVNKPIYQSLRVVGMLVFYTQLFVDHFVKLAIDFANKKIGININPFHFVLTLMFTLLFSVLLEKLSKKEKLSWLKYLYS